MSQPFASGNNSIQFCDRCGWRYPYGTLKMEIVKKRPTGLLVCPTCHDPDHPLLMLGTFPVFDPQALRMPRRDVNRNVSNAITYTVGQSPFPVIGATIGCPAGAAVGSVTIFIH